MTNGPPKAIAQMNDYQFKLVRLQGEFVWHEHTDTDDTFIVLEGSLVIDFKEGSVTLNAGEMVVVPKGCLHRPRADNRSETTARRACRGGQYWRYAVCADRTAR